MSRQFFVRIRGRVNGPFDEEKMRSLTRRGQVGRMHEVSENGLAWNKASDYPDLFTQPQTVAATRAIELPEVDDQGEYQVEGAKSEPEKEPTPSEARWYYVDGDQETGPIDRGALQAMIANGQVTTTAQVWTDGMPDWIPAHDVPGLATPPSVAIGQVANQRSALDDHERTSQMLGRDVSRAFSQTRPWVLFIAVVGYLYGFFSTLVGVYFVVEGADTNVVPITATGLFSLVYAILALTGSTMLVLYVTKMSHFESYRSEVRLVRVLDSLRSFWIYVSILLMICIALIVIVSIWVFSLAEAIGDMGAEPWMTN